MTEDSDRKSRAVVVFLGHGVESWPSRYPERLVEEFGEEQGLDLVMYADAVLDELFAVPIDWSKEPDLWKGTDGVVAVVAERHPELNAEALQALRGYYAFQSK